MVSKDLRTDRITLRPIEETDYPVLHKWRNEFRFLSLFSSQREVVSFENFVRELKAEFGKNRHMQFVIESNRGGMPIGTLFTFSLSRIDGFVFINVYIDSNHENRGYGVEAVALLVNYLFTFLPIRKVCFEAFEYNNLSLSTLRKGSKYGLCEEGRFKEQGFTMVGITMFSVLLYTKIRQN